jgi:hypothetical protein
MEVVFGSNAFLIFFAVTTLFLSVFLIVEMSAYAPRIAQKIRKSFWIAFLLFFLCFIFSENLFLILACYFFYSQKKTWQTFLFATPLFVLFLGFSCNFLALVANHDRMPAPPFLVSSQDPRHSTINSQTQLLPLCDVFVFRDHAFSIGDVLIFISHFAIFLFAIEKMIFAIDRRLAVFQRFRRKQKSAAMRQRHRNPWLEPLL